MNVKNFLICSIVGFIVYYFLGGLFYGMLFPDIHPKSENTNMMFILLGCLFYAVMIAYIWCQWVGLKEWMSGLKAGAILGFIGSLSGAFFMFSNRELNTTHFIEDVFAMTVSAAIMGAVMAFINGKLSK